MDNKEFLESLRDLGFGLMETASTPDANQALARLASSQDLRMWEGFPVVLANSAERNLFDWPHAKEILFKQNEERYFDLLVLMSLALYQALGLKFGWAEKLYQSLSDEQRKELDRLRNDLAHEQYLNLGDKQMSVERLKNTLNRYLRKKESRFSDFLALKSESNLEYALSQLFSAKQKELLLKKLQGEKMTKTETEYFSRTVKKKVLALANPELHRLAQKLLE